ncbi:MAG: hypothetical protein AB7O88_14050 [Reyranellaceae bacterium]
MGKDRRGRLLSYLALAWLGVGLLVHALPASAAGLVQGWQRDVVFDIDSADDPSVLPSPLRSRDLRGQRSPRTPLDSGADSDALAVARAGPIGPAGGTSFFLFDTERRGLATPRLAHRPRDPPSAA